MPREPTRFAHFAKDRLMERRFHPTPKRGPLAPLDGSAGAEPAVPSLMRDAPAPAIALLPPAELPIGTRIAEPFVVLDRADRATNDDRPFATLTLANHQGAIGTTVWSEALPQWDGVAAERVVFVHGQIVANKRNGAMELKVDRVRLLGPTEPEAQRMDGVLEARRPVAPTPLPELEARFKALVDGIQHPGYQLFLRNFFLADTPVVAWSQFRESAAAVGKHHATRHGLLLHTVQVASHVRDLLRTPEYAGANVDLGTLQALLHDVGKTGPLAEYEASGRGFRVTPRGALYNHMTTGSLYIERCWWQHEAALRAAGVERQDIDHLHHAVAAHHGKLEWGAPVVPRTLEVTALHIADLASAQLMAAQEFVAESRLSAGFLERPGARWSMLPSIPPMMRVTASPATLATPTGNAPASASSRSAPSSTSTSASPTALAPSEREPAPAAVL